MTTYMFTVAKFIYKQKQTLHEKYLFKLFVSGLVNMINLGCKIELLRRSLFSQKI